MTSRSNFALLRVDFFKRFFSGQQLGGNRLEHGLLLSLRVFELENICIESAEFALLFPGDRLHRAGRRYHGPGSRYHRA